MIVDLPDPEATEHLGRDLADTLPERPPFPALLLMGDLGAGKTTLTRGLVAALPGGGEAEVSSPSFNICNLYPTRPETAHLDLYRLAGGCLDDSLADDLAEGRVLAVVEWAERLAGDEVPEDRLVATFHDEAQAGRMGRRVTLEARGKAAEAWLARLAEQRAGRAAPEFGTR